MIKTHSFHIPVMGIGFTIDTPLKVSPLGIDAVISLVDDILVERLRKMYSEKYELAFEAIAQNSEDFRARRITAYLNLINSLARQKFNDLRNAIHAKGTEIKEYFELMPDSSAVKAEFKRLMASHSNLADIKDWIYDNLSMGSIDVNIMTKLDNENYKDKELLPTEYNDAHAALRGYANSDLESSIILSAGINPRLYTYIEQFEDFFPDENGKIKKKLVLKVSDYRSALVQGRFLAKKGLWVSEFRVESGLNCGGHAFATEGYLLGPILAEFRDKRDELRQSLYEITTQVLAEKGRPIPNEMLPLKISAQGGVGTAEEHQFLLDHYKVDSVGWGSPFLLVPEAVVVEKGTLAQLCDAKEEDLYLSGISPLGVAFNSLRGNTKDMEKEAHIAKGRPGSSCPKRYVALNKEFTQKGICIASRQYQHLKLQALTEKNLPEPEYQKAYSAVVEKSCICVGLGTTALLANDLDTRVEGSGVSVCPGPNIAYFDKIISLKEMVGHIYGRGNVMTRTDRPNMFVKELGIYLEYYIGQLEAAGDTMDKKQEKSLKAFAANLNDGIDYYHQLFSGLNGGFSNSLSQILSDLAAYKKDLNSLSFVNA